MLGFDKNDLPRNLDYATFFLDQEEVTKKIKSLLWNSIS